MIIQVIKDKSEYRINQSFASAVTEFSTLIDGLGVLYMIYVIYVTDMGEDNLYALLPKKIREKTVADDLNLSAALLKDDRVKAALKKYLLFCNENTAYKFKAAYDEGMDKLTAYMGKQKVLDDESVDSFAKTLKMMPEILEGREKIGKAGAKEEAKRGIVRGKRQLTAAEKAHT